MRSQRKTAHLFRCSRRHQLRRQSPRLPHHLHHPKNLHRRSQRLPPEPPTTPSPPGLSPTNIVKFDVHSSYVAALRNSARMNRLDFLFSAEELRALEVALKLQVGLRRSRYAGCEKVRSRNLSLTFANRNTRDATSSQCLPGRPPNHLAEASRERRSKLPRANSCFSSGENTSSFKGPSRSSQPVLVGISIIQVQAARSLRSIPNNQSKTKPDSPSQPY
jgi:hypothetical protein